MPLPERDLERILEAGRIVGSTLRLPELLQTVTKLAGEVVRSEASSILLMDAATGELYFDIALGEKGGALQQVRLKTGEGIAGWVAEHKQSVVVNDVAHDPRWTQKADQTSQFKTKSILAVPMIVRDRIIGVMEAINRADGQPYSDLDVQLLETFGSQAAVAIENARLFESIRQEKEKMDTILSEMIEAVILLDEQGRVLVKNATAERLFAGELATGLWKDLESKFTVKPPWSGWSEGSGQIRMIEVSRQAPPPFILSGVINTIRNDREGVTGFLLVLSDVTEERREALLKRNFLALVSHKLKTPLVAIRGFTPLLLEKPEELTSFQKTAIETIDRNSLQLASLVEKLVWFAALEGDKFELTQRSHLIPEILDAAFSNLAALLRSADIEVKEDQSLGTLPAVLVDKVWTKEVFRNVVENALKFNTKDAKKITVSGKVVDRHVHVTFRDNGPGIPAEEQQKIFQKFYQIDSSFTGQIQGMGLGLALVKRVVEEQGGRVSVESQLGEGSTFTITLPIA